MADSQGFVSVAESTQPFVPSAATTTTGSNSGNADRGVTGQVVELFKGSAHPKVAIFHVLFKTLALLFYLLSGFVTESFVIVFVVCVVLMAFDFWTVKNVTGRFMVGLRWWNDVTEDGTSTWRYESIEDPTQISRADYIIFWYSMYLAGLAWIIFAFLAILKPDWLLVCIVCFVLIWSNINGFWNCSSERARVQQSVQSAITQGTVAAMSSGWFARAQSQLAGASAPAAGKTGDLV